MASSGGLTFTTTVRVIDRVHRDSTDLWSLAHPAIAAGFTKRYVFMLGVANLTHCRVANNWNSSDLAGRHTQLCIVAFLRYDLSETASGANELPAFART
jgi:hypothetical protein